MNKRKFERFVFSNREGKVPLYSPKKKKKSSVKLKKIKTFKPCSKALKGKTLSSGGGTMEEDLSGVSTTLSLTQELKTRVVHPPMVDQSKNLPPSLVLMLGPKSLMGKHWVIHKPEMRVGRGRNNDICIQDPSISKTHVLIQKSSEGKICIKDQKSTNGIFLNHEPVKGEVLLKDKDQMQMGNVVLKFLDQGNLELLFISSQFKRSFQDNLTEVGNRALLECRGPEIFKLSRQNSKPLCVVIFDIDRFKNINDSYGHVAGDKVLKEVAALARSCFRSRDLITRCGGEEFCVVLNAHLDRGKEYMEKVRSQVAAHKFHFESHTIRLTLSAGLSQLQQGDKNWLDIYKRADKALYYCKSHGRNQVRTQ